MKTIDACLTLVVPRRHAAAVVDALLAHGGRSNGFVAQPVAIHGLGLDLAGGDEEVRGHATRTELRVLLNRDDAATLLAVVRAAMPGGDLLHWLLPVLPVLAPGAAPRSAVSPGASA